MGSYQKPKQFFVRDEMGPGEVTPWPVVEEALERAGITPEEWDARITVEDTVAGLYTRVPFTFCWLGGKLVAGRSGTPPPWRSGQPIIPGQTVAFIVVAFKTDQNGTFTQHYGNLGSAEDAEKFAQKLTDDRRASAFQLPDVTWEYKPAKVVIL